MKQPHSILPNSVYDVESLQTCLGLTKTTIGREVRLGRLRVSKRAGRYFVIGRWVLQWIAEGERRCKQGRENKGESRE
jgi:hypothetical protein